MHTFSRRVRVGLTLAIAAGAVVALPAVASATSFSSTFTANDEGWTVEQNALCGDFTHHTPTFAVSGGNPGGRISTTDTRLAGDDCATVAVAPASWSGNMIANYGGVASYDAFSSTTSPDIPQTIIIQGVANDQLIAQVASPPAQNTWTTMSTSR